MAVQAEYGVANRTASWRTRLMHIALTLFHCVRSRARERLGVSAGLRGNGMSFATTLLRDVPHDGTVSGMLSALNIAFQDLLRADSCAMHDGAGCASKAMHFLGRPVALIYRASGNFAPTPARIPRRPVVPASSGLILAASCRPCAGSEL